MLTADASHLDYFKLVREHRRLDRSQLQRAVRVAVLSDASTQHLVPLIEVLLARAGFAAAIHAAEFDTIEAEILDPASGLHRHEPDVVVVLPCAAALRHRYHDAGTDRATFGTDVAERHAGLWDALRARSKATVVHANFVVPYEREFGSFGLKVRGSLHTEVLAANARLAELARERSHVLLCDVEGIASYVGKRTFFDERMWTVAKTFAALEHLPRVAQAVVDVVVALRGRSVKCVVLDLDNTTWGGIIGDDGLEGIHVGHYGEGEPFYRFQQFVRELKRRGVILAVCSKNEHDVAIRAFREHPEMVLREEDVAVFVANWDTKVDNIRRIKETLNIGYDAMVFLDDNPFERNIVRQYLPEVIVPDLPEEPGDYVRALAELNLFETTSFTDEDRQRADLYREEAVRKTLQSSFTNVDDYLRSLEMKIACRRFDASNAPRIAQLIQRSNQFNLTTRRQSQADCEALVAAGDDVVPLYLKLADRFGDYGLISVIVARVTAEHLLVDTWLMSCRVLARGVEEYAMNRLVSLARERGVPVIVGEYFPTAKNAMVKDFYARFGFRKTREDDRGNATWVLEVAAYEPRTTYLSEAEA